MKIVIIDTIYFLPQDLANLKALGEVVMYESEPKDDAEKIERTKDADVLIGYWDNLSAEVINAASHLKLIVSAASGYDWIDAKAAREKGIVVTHCPGNNAEAVAEHTMLLILTAVRNLKKVFNDIDAKKYTPMAYQGIDLVGKTLGIIGYGRIGKRVGEIAEKGFGMKIISFDSVNSREDLEALLATSDVVCVNAPLNDQTYHLLSDKEFDLMKKDVILVNTGRGKVIDEAALIANIKNGKIRAAALDVMEEEPFNFSSELFSFSNVALTPHMSWNTKETDERLSTQVVEIVQAFKDGAPKYVIPE